jgi:hypothetical protein
VQAANRNPVRNAGRTSRGLAQQQTRNMEATIPPIIGINHDSRRSQEHAINVGGIPYGRTQSQAMDPNDNPFRRYPRQVGNTNAMHNGNVGRQSQATNVNQNFTVRAPQIVKNEERATSARRRGPRHEWKDVWMSDSME